MLTTEVSNYINQISKFPILTRDEEKQTIEQAKNGDNKARNKLINSNLLLIVKLANGYSKIMPATMDLVQEGNMAAFKAFEKFEPQRGLRFNTYLGHWARGYMLRYIFNNSHMMKTATTNEQRKLFYTLRKEQARLKELGITADTETLAENLNVDEDVVIEMDSRLNKDLYIDAPISENDETKSYTEYISSPSEEQPDNKLERNQFNKVLNGKLDDFAKKLTNYRHREIFEKRVVAEDPETLTILGKRLNITRQRTQQLEAQVKAKLRRYLQANKINASY